ncbi:MAG: hypothetical protein H7A25_17135 [Leptospiraceae bacterium]|nr:hypothetical protein [Leptospiraceae bacterium]MCP5501630.1 hypothetical protein [Leptospiraceae bacterium]
MNLNKYIALFSLLSFVYIYPLFASPDDLNIGTIQFEAGRNYHRFYKKGVGIIKREGKNKEFIIGFEDPYQKTYFFLQGKAKTRKKNQLLYKFSSNLHPIKLAFRHIDNNYFVESSVDFLPDTASLPYGELRRHQRLASEVDVVPNQNMGGTELVFQIKLIKKEKRVIEIQGIFFGKVKFSNNLEARIEEIKNGEFRVPVLE